MTSSEIDLQEENLKKPGCFTFTWSIHNFSHCALEMNKCIESPIFTVESIGGSEWKLMLYPKGYNTPGFISCYLRQLNTPEKYLRAYTFSFRKCDGTFEKKYEEYGRIVKMIRAKDFRFREKNLISHLELNEPGAYLENDTLTISCRMWKEGADLAESETYCYAHTEVRVSKLECVWNLRNIVIPNTSGYKFNHSAEITAFISGVPKVEMRVLNQGSQDEEVVHFGIKMPQQEKDVFLVTKVHILDKDEKTTHSACAEHLFKCANKSQMWYFPIISKLILHLNKQICMPSGELALKCEFSFSGDPEARSISYEYYGYDIQELKCVTRDPSTDGYELWKENLCTSFTGEKLRDVVLRTSSHEFPAHRAILCAHSEVFLAMLENDTNEKKTGIIEIEDLEDDTVNKVLSYLYTNAIEGLDSSAAQKLYYAAGRYGIKALLRICSNRLMHNLDTSNVCEILLLADTYQDEELKTSTTDFILDHVQEVIDSEKWKSVMKDNSSVTSEVTQLILERQVKLLLETNSKLSFYKLFVPMALPFLFVLFLFVQIL